MPDVKVVDPLDVLPSGSVRDLAPALALARAVAPVARLGPAELAQFPGAADFDIAAQLGGRDHAYVCFRRDEILHVLRDTTSFSSENLRAFVGDFMSGSLSLTDGPAHARLRGLVSYAFRAPALEAWREGLITPLTHTLIDGFIEDGRAELNSQFAVELPIQVIAGVLGLPRAQLDQFRAWAFAIVATSVDRNRAAEAAAGIKECIAGLLETRRASNGGGLVSDGAGEAGVDGVSTTGLTQGGDLITDLATAEVDGQRLDASEILDVVLQLVVAGTETTYRGVGTTMFALLTHPDELRVVLDDPSLVAIAVEEALRWEPPLPTDIRAVIRPTTLGTYDLEPGDIVILSLASANRDESVFADPERFWVRRPTNPHITFATGPHVCLGNTLARMELTVAVGALLQRLRNIRFDPEVEAPFMRGALVRGPNRVPVVFDADNDRFDADNDRFDADKWRP